MFREISIFFTYLNVNYLKNSGAHNLKILNYNDTISCFSLLLVSSCFYLSSLHFDEFYCCFMALVNLQCSWNGLKFLADQANAHKLTISLTKQSIIHLYKTFYSKKLWECKITAHAKPTHIYTIGSISKQLKGLMQKTWKFRQSDNKYVDQRLTVTDLGSSRKDL